MSCQEEVGINTKGLFLKVEMGKDRVSRGPFSLSDGAERARQGLYNTPPGAPGDAIIPPVGPGAGGSGVGGGQGSTELDILNQTNLTPLLPPTSHSRPRLTEMGGRETANRDP